MENETRIRVGSIVVHIRPIRSWTGEKWLNGAACDLYQIGHENEEPISSAQALPQEDE